MVPLEKCVWWIAWRWMGTNRLHQFDGHGHPLHLHPSNLRHTSQFLHHSTSNSCTFSTCKGKNNMIVRLEKSVWWVAWRSMDINWLHDIIGHGGLHRLHSSNWRHTSQFSHHSTSNYCTFSARLTDSAPGKESLMNSQTIDGHQQTAPFWQA